MVKIRLKRMGTKKRPFYRLVVADARSPRDGRFIETVGFYDPLPNPAKVEIDADKVRDWIRKGARPSDSARDLLVAQGVLPGRTTATAVAEPEAAPVAAAETAPVAEPAIAGAEAAAEAPTDAAAETPSEADSDVASAETKEE